MSKISKAQVFYLRLFDELLSVRFEGDNYSIEYSNHWNYLHYKKYKKPSAKYANRVYKVGSDFMEVATDKGMTQLSLNNDLLPIGGTDRFRRLINDISISAFINHILPVCWKTYLITEGFSTAGYCSNMDLQIQIKDKYLQNPWIEDWLGKFSRILNRNFVFKFYGTDYFVFHKRNTPFETRDYFYIRALYRLLKMIFSDKDVIWHGKIDENTKKREVPVDGERILLYNHTLHPDNIFMIPDSIFVMYRDELITVVDNLVYDYFWGLVLKKLLESKSMFSISEFLNTKVAWMRIESERESERYTMMSALTKRDRRVYPLLIVSPKIAVVSSKLVDDSVTNFILKSEYEHFINVFCPKYMNFMNISASYQHNCFVIYTVDPAMITHNARFYLYQYINERLDEFQKIFNVVRTDLYEENVVKQNTGCQEDLAEITNAIVLTSMDYLASLILRIVNYPCDVKYIFDIEDVIDQTERFVSAINRVGFKEMSKVIPKDWITALNFKVDVREKYFNHRLQSHFEPDCDKDTELIELIPESITYKFLDVNSGREAEVVDHVDYGVNVLTKKTWREFRETGLLWFINSILHVFGWAISVSSDIENPDGDYIASINRTKYRGFSEASNTKGYREVSKYLKDNIDDLVKEANED